MPLRLAIAALCALCGCRGATPDPGLDLQMRVRGAQLVRAALPAEAGGPAVTLVDVRGPRVSPGDGAVRVAGRTAGGAFALNVAIDRDDAHWVLESGLPDSEVPGELAWEALLDFSRALAPGPFQVRLQAVDGEGRPGPVAEATLEALPLYPLGALVITLEWDQNLDADLLVETPSGVLLGGKNLNTVSQPPPGGSPLPPDAFLDGGVLDQDSNANCVLDGRRRENAVWSASAPAGHYRVFAALAQTCGVDSSQFEVTVRREGELVGRALGALRASDALSYPGQPPQAPGVLALELDVP